MAKIVPICGVRYNTKKAGPMEGLITPPYDVINEKQQQGYYEKNPYNIIRLEYGETRPHDNEEDNRYTRASGFFASWISGQILLHEDKPAVYIYEQEFTVHGKKRIRSGFMAGVGVEEYETGMILPHEETLSKAKQDRLELLRHCEANFSPIFGLYEDASCYVENIADRYKQAEPVCEFADENGEIHRMWIICNEDELRSISEFFIQQKIYIADGHHRYETALNFHKEKLTDGDDRFGFCLMTLVNLYDPGLVILPTYRMVKNITGFNAKEFLVRLGDHFTVTQVELPAHATAETLSAEMQSLASLIDEYNAYLLYVGDQSLYRLTTLRCTQHDIIERKYAAYSPQWRTLDVAVLQCLVLEELLGIDSQARAGGNYLTYTRDESDAIAKVDSKEYQAVFYLNPTLVHEVTGVAAAGDKMPQKSTYFYPKLVTGLVINDFSK